MSQPMHTSAVPPAVADKLRRVRQRKIGVHATSAVVACVVVLLAAMCIAMLIDWLATLYDSSWRVVLTNAALGAAAATLVGWLAAAWRSSRWQRIAAEVDRQVPQLEERWATVADLARHTADPRLVHPAMFRRVASEAASLEPHVNPEQVVTLSPVIRTMLGLTAVTAALAVAVLIDSQQTSVLLRRFWWPRSLVSATQIVGLPGDTVVGRGEPLTIAASLEGRPADRALLRLRPQDEAEQSLTLLARAVQPLAFSHRIRSVDEPFEYSLRSGDGQSPWFRVEVADRPEIDEVRLVVTPPAYTGRPAKTFKSFPRRISMLEGSQLHVAIRPTAAVQSVEMKLDGSETVRLAVDAEGWHRWTTILNETVVASPLLTEPHGLTNRRAPRCEFHVYPDSVPVVKILAPDDQLAVRADDTVQVTFTAQDDVGISMAELLVYDESTSLDGQPVPIAAIPIPLKGQQGARRVQETVELDLTPFALVEGAEFSYEIRVRESRGGVAERTSDTSSAEAAESSSAVAGSDEGSSADRQRTSSAAATASADASADVDHEASPREPATRGAAVGSAIAEQPADSRAADVQPESQPLASPTPQPSAIDITETAPADRARSDVEAGPTAADATSERSATSGRRALTSDRAADAAREEAQAAERAAQSASAMAEQGSQAQSSSGGSAPSDGERKQAASSASKSRASNRSSSSASASASDAAGASPAAESPATRSLDVARSSTSLRQRLKVDQWAGSFSSLQRIKLELAIAPQLAAIDKHLATAQRTARGVLDEIEPDRPWRGNHALEVTAAEGSAEAAQKVVDALQKSCEGTPYAFVGLQIVDIAQAHVKPARSDLWETLQSEGADRVTALGNALQHLGRARELLAELTGQFDRARREYKLAESIERVKKMYEVYIENSLALLEMQQDDPDRYARKLAEFDVDDEYLKRLREVLEMRRDLQAELARILADDPRLLRRFMDSLRYRVTNLREELAALVASQQELNREVLAWTQVDEANRALVADVLARRAVQDALQIASATGELQSRYETWLPLNRDLRNEDLTAATERMQQMAAAGAQLQSAAERYVARPGPNVQAVQPQPGADVAQPQPPVTAVTLDDLLTDGQRLYDNLTKLEVMLRQLGAREQDPEVSALATNRLIETRDLIADTSAWIAQLTQHKAGKYALAAEVEQYRLANETDRLAGRLGGLEQSLAAMLQKPGGLLPEPIAIAAREFLSTLDEQAAPGQLAAVFALRGDDLARAVEQQKAAGDALVRAEDLYDELMRMAIEELDKLPVQDPIADLLDDPTLDELLRQLEQEQSLAELLGIPNRPSNLRIIGDWSRRGSGSIGGGMRRWMLYQMRQDERLARQRLDEAYRRAIARALKEAEEAAPIAPAESVVLSDWNRLLSQLADNVQQGRDNAPPEQYRLAIEQYFAEISRAAAKRDEAADDAPREP